MEFCLTSRASKDVKTPYLLPGKKLQITTVVAEAMSNFLKCTNSLQGELQSLSNPQIPLPQ